MCKRHVSTIVAGAILALVIVPLQAVTIPIENPGFEDPVVADGEYVYSLDNQGWGYFDNGGEQGSWNPGLSGSSEPGYGGDAPEGQNVAWVNPGGTGVPGGLAQVLTDADAMLKGDMTYTLTVQVGNTLGYPWSGYKVQLLAGGIPHTPGTGADTGPVAGGTLLAEDNNSLTIAEDTFETSTVTYTYDPGLHSNLLGEPLQIRLLCLGNVASGDYTEVDFDDVTLSYEVTTTAKKPMPADGAVDVPATATLTWAPGQGATAHDLYLGESFEDVNTATVPTVSGVDVNSFDPGAFEFGKVIFWRVDEVHADKTVFRGSVWHFEVEPYSIPIPGSAISATASSSSSEFSLPEKTLDGSGLGEDEIHDTKTENMWFSAMGDTEPWIQYEFEVVKKLDVMTVWNSNSTAEGFIGYGVKDVTIEYSKDGETWDLFEDVNEFSRAPGTLDYNQYDAINLGGLAAKMVRLSIQSNFGGFMQSYSLSEVQFSMIPVAARTPVPESGAVDISPDVMLSWRAGREAVQSIVYLGIDPNEVADGLAASASTNSNSLDLSNFDIELGQTYYWRVDEVNETEAVSVWAGPVWSFSAADASIVDDFESYGNDSPNRPFQVWLDGFGYSADEFFPVGYGGNGTGAGVGHDIWSVASDHYNGNIMEKAITLEGSSQSLPFYYNNAGATPQMDRTWVVPQDWTRGGAETLVLYFYGASDNTGQLYVQVNNGPEVQYEGSADAIDTGVWTQWNIDLTSLGVDLQSVTQMSIGVQGGSGMILIDNIRLYRDAPGISDSVTYSFDDLPGGGDAADGMHGGIDFGTGDWWGGDSWYGVAQCGYFSGNFADVPISFTLPVDTHLLSLVVSSDDAYSYSISDGVNADIVGTTGTVPEVINTNWTSGGSTITITTAGGWNVVFDDITYIASE